ncbi:MAG: Na/Pi symporter [Cyanobacteria bacterium P01_F01_bin.143]
MNSEPIIQENQKQNILFSWLGVIFLVYLLICAVSTISGGFQTTAGDRAKELFTFAANPFAGLIVGILCTALIQSSSTVTSIIVALVAGGLPVATAVPMVMGSNIGTTITNTLVSLGHVQNENEFKRAFAAATIHDFFNLLSVIIFLPLEIATGFLEKTGAFVASFFVGGSSASMTDFNFVKAAIEPVTGMLNSAAYSLPHPYNGIILIITGIILIFFAIYYIGKLLKVLLVGKAKTILKAAIGKGPLTGIFSGTLVTVLVQSSSTTTSLVVPLAGTGILTLEEIYPFTLGANIGTCITALLAATAVPENQAAALEIASIHLLYNIIGTIIIYSISFLRNIPILGAETLAAVASERKYLAFVYIITVFFLIPAILLTVTGTKSW